MTKPNARDPRIPAIGSVSQAERLFRVNWVAAELRAPSGAQLLPPELVAQQGRRIKLVDIRTEEEVRGPLGHIPGCEWVSPEECDAIPDRFDHDVPFVFVSRGGERSAAVAKRLEDRGMRFSASLLGGMVSWKRLGFSTLRESPVLSRRGVLADYRVPATQKRELGEADIRAHIGDPAAVRWIRMAALLLHGHVSCVDGRDDAGVIGTPGGDAGELVLGFTAFEQVTGRTLRAEEIERAMRVRLDTWGSFYLHSDIHASNKLVGALRADPRVTPHLGGVSEALEWRAFLGDPPREVQDALLEHLLTPENMGCGHLRLMVQHPERYGVRAELVLAVLAAFYRARWAGSTEATYVILGGGHEEGAVVRVGLERDVWPFSRIPLVSPQCEGTQMFVAHAQVVRYLRRQMAALMARAVGLDAAGEEAVFARIEQLGDRGMGETLGQLAKGLPILDVRFDEDGAFTLVTSGRV